MIAERFYDEYSTNNKNKASEGDATKGKTEEKVSQKKIIWNFSKYSLNYF